MALGIRGGERGFADPAQPVQRGNGEAAVLARQSLFYLCQRVAAAKEMRRHAHRNVRLSKNLAAKSQTSRGDRLRIRLRVMMTTVRRLWFPRHEMLS
jgi:hypothetical protein